MRVALAAAALLLTACGARTAPTPGGSRGAIPDLVGVQVMVFPVQLRQGVAGDPTAELVDALGARGRGVRWLMPDSLRALLARSPSLDVPLDAMPVGVFLRTQVNRIGDPIFAYLRRLNALTGGKVALIPVEIRARAATAERPAVVELAVALVDAESGRVYWFGVVEGEPGDGGSPRALASTADALARRLFPPGA